MKYCERINEKLKKNFNPTFLEVIDESESHSGHVGSRPEGETHFRVKMASYSFMGMSRIDQQRLVYNVLKLELKERVHALALELSIPKS